MTNERRKEINPKLCAEGLHRFLNNYHHLLEYKEKAIFYGAISLLYDCESDEWLSKSTDEYDKWSPFDEN